MDADQGQQSSMSCLLQGLSSIVFETVCSSPVGNCTEEAHSIPGAQQDAVPDGAKRKAEQASGQPAATQSRATSQDAAPPRGAAVDVTPTARSKHSEVADASKTVSDDAPFDAKLDIMNVIPAAQQDLKPSQALEPIQKELASPAAASEAKVASTPGNSEGLDPEAGAATPETGADMQSLSALAPASVSTAVAEVQAAESKSSPATHIVSSKQAPLSKTPEAADSGKHGGPVTQPKAEHVNGSSAERAVQEEKHSKPAENGGLTEEEAGAPARPLRPAAKRTRRA